MQNVYGVKNKTFSESELQNKDLDLKLACHNDIIENETEHQKQINSLLNSRRTEVRQKDAKIQELENKIDDCEIKMRKLEREIRLLTRNLKDNKEELVESEEKKDELEDKYKTLSKKYKDLTLKNSEFEQSKHSFEKLEQANKYLTDSLATLSTKLKSLENNELEMEIKNNQLNEKEITIGSLKNEIEKKCRAITIMREKINVAENRELIHDKESNDKDEMIETLKEKLAVSEKMKDELNAKFKNLAREHKEIKKDVPNEEETGNLNNSLQLRNSEVNESRNLLEKLKQENRNLTDSLTKLENQVKSSENTLLEMEKKNNELEDKSKSLAEENEKKAKAITTMREKIKSKLQIDFQDFKKLQYQLKAKEMEYDQAAQKIQNLLSAYDKECDYHELAKITIDQLRSEVDSLKGLNLNMDKPREIKELEEKCKQLEEDNDRKTRALTTMREKIKSTPIDSKIEIQEFRKLQNQLRAKEMENDQAIVIIENLHCAYDKESNEHDLAKKTIKQLISEIDSLKRLN